MDTRQQKNKSVSTDEWYTPKWIIDLLGSFDLDPCSPEHRPFDTANVHWTKQQDGLKMPWGKTEDVRVWLNPPYSRPLVEQFIRKMADHNNGIALLVNRQDNVMWQEVIFPTAASMIFMRHRVQFLTLTVMLASRSLAAALLRGVRKMIPSYAVVVSRVSMLF